MNLQRPEIRAIAPYAPAFLLLAYLLLALGSMSGEHPWGDDWAQYLLHAQNLIEGRSYSDIGYLFNPDAPNVGPPSYPPGLPVLLAPVLAVFGVNVVMLKLACFACIVLALPFLYRALSLAFGAVVAAVTVVLFALHDQLWSYRDFIASEPAYILFSVLALWYATRTEDAGPRASLATGTVLGILVYATVACRSIGISLFLALLVYGWAQRRRLGWFTGLCAAFALLMVLQNLLIIMPPTYANELKAPTAGLLVQNLRGYWMALASYVRQPLGLSQAAAAVVLALAATGAWSACTRREADPPAGGLRALAAGVPLVLWYLGAYSSALILAAIAANDRYLLPVLPFVIALAAAGVEVVARRVPRSRRYALPLAVALGVYYLALHVSAPRLRADQIATCESCRELYAFAQAHTPPGTVIAFAKPRAMALLTGRPAWMWSPDYSAGELRQKLNAVGAKVIVMVAPGNELAEKYPAQLEIAALAREPGSKIVFQNRMFTAIRLAE